MQPLSNKVEVILLFFYYSSCVAVPFVIAINFIIVISLSLLLLLFLLLLFMLLLISLLLLSLLSLLDSLREKCLNTELFLVRIFLYSVRIQENTEQK